MNDPDSISHPVALGSPTLDPIPRLEAWLGSTELNSARLAVDDVFGGSHCTDMSVDWSLTWHTNCAC
jgi:hypothetical protein